MFFYSRLRTTFRSYLSLAALLSVGLTVAQPSLAQETTEEGAEDWVAASMCEAGNRAVDLTQAPSFSFTAADGNNPRHRKHGHEDIKPAGPVVHFRIVAADARYQLQTP